MVDCHTHILPDIDDGAKNIEISKEMLKTLHSQSVKTIFLTPHFFYQEESVEDFLKRRDEAYLQIKPFADELGLTLVLACEMYYTESMFNIEDISPLCIGGKDHLLLEIPYNCTFSSYTIEKIRKMVINQNIVPIFAHIERYSNLFKDEDLINEFIYMGCKMQFNLSSLDSGYFNKKRILKYIKEGLLHVFGTDCHNMTHRAPDYIRYRDIIIKKLGNDCFDDLVNNALNIIN